MKSVLFIYLLIRLFDDPLSTVYVVEQEIVV